MYIPCAPSLQVLCSDQCIFIYMSHVLQSFSISTSDPSVSSHPRSPVLCALTFYALFLSGIYHAWHCYICALARACDSIVKLIIFQSLHCIDSFNLLRTFTWHLIFKDKSDVLLRLNRRRLTHENNESLRRRLSMTSERLWASADPWPMSAMAGPWLTANHDASTDDNRPNCSGCARWW